MKFETAALHGGKTKEYFNHSVVAPIYQTTAYEFDNIEHAVDLFDLKTSGDIYTRMTNPTTSVLDERMTLLCGGIGAMAVASGQSATMLAVLNIAKAGDEILACSTLYGGTYNLLSVTLKKMGITVKFVDPDDFDGFEKAMTDKTKAIFAETIGNPLLNVVDIEKLAQIAHAHKIPLLVDNTVPTPYLCRTFEHGADIEIYSATKYIGGHGNSLCGVVVDSGKFDWAASGKFPDLVNPDPSYHGLSFTEAFGKAAFIAKCRVHLLRDIGAAISPMNSFLILQGVETLALRMERHSENALKLAQYLEGHPQVCWVNYPGLKTHKYHERAKKYMPNGCSSLIGFGIKGDGKKFIEGLQLCTHATNLGDVRTIVTYPAGTTHRQLSCEQKEACGITDDFIRISVGLENLDDIIEDINRSLEKCK